MTAFAFSAKAGQTQAQDAARVSGPLVHDNLAVYFIHGRSAPGEVPLTLDEAIKLERVRVFETGEVNELKIENVGDQPVFIQSGDIVKGGRQDRVITSSFVLKPKSGAVPVSAFCVEQGRWSSRGGESAAVFASSRESMPSRRAKMSLRAAAMEMPRSSGAPRPGSPRSSVSRQAEVWDEVGEVQRRLSDSVRSDVTASASASSLQLSLENEKLQTDRSVYVNAFQEAGDKDDDIVGYAFAINGKLNAADVYASNGLFRKMWLKQLQSAATEALGERDGARQQAPAAATVMAFLKETKETAVKDAVEHDDNRVEIRESRDAVYMAASPSGGAVIHENYLAK